MSELTTNPKDIIGRTKPDLALVPFVAMIEESKALTCGAAKYGEWNWRGQSVSARVYVSAAMRHLLAWHEGEDADKESGASPLGHVKACMSILMDAASVGKLVDDRPTKHAATNAATQTVNEPQSLGMPRETEWKDPQGVNGY